LKNNNSSKKIARWIIGIVTACIVIYLGLRNLGVVADAFNWVINIVFPLILGLAFALIINVPMRFFESHLFRKSKGKVVSKIRKPLSFVLALLLILGIVSGVISLVIPELISAIKLIADYIIDMVSDIEKTGVEKLPFGNLLKDVDWKSVVAGLEKWLKEESGTIMNSAVVTISAFIGGVVDLFIAFVFSIYILFNKESLKRQATRLIKAWLPRKFGEWIIHAADVSSKVFRNFISGQTLEGLILGSLCMIGMFILRLPYAPMVGALVGVTALVPVVGSLTGAIVGAFMIATESPVKALIFLVFLLVLQQIEGNFIYPKVMSSRINLPPIWVLAAITIGGGLAGAIGMLVAVPTVSVIYLLVKEATESREKSNNESSDSSNNEQSITGE